MLRCCWPTLEQLPGPVLWLRYIFCPNVICRVSTWSSHRTRLCERIALSRANGNDDDNNNNNNNKGLEKYATAEYEVHRVYDSVRLEVFHFYRYCKNMYGRIGVRECISENISEF